MLQQKIMKENNLVQQGIAIISEAKACQYIHLLSSVAKPTSKGDGHLLHKGVYKLVIAKLCIHSLT